MVNIIISLQKYNSAAKRAGEGAPLDSVAAQYYAPTLADGLGPYCSIEFLRAINERIKQFQNQNKAVSPQPFDPLIIKHANQIYRIYRLCLINIGWLMGLAVGAIVGIFGWDNIIMGLLLPGGFLAFLGGVWAAPNLNDILSFDWSKTIQNAFQMAYGLHNQYTNRKEYWVDLKWREFEIEVATLFNGIGFDAKATPGSGDKGVDVVAHKNGKKVIIQCKKYNKIAGPHMVRELLGTLVKERAYLAILICTSGFSNAASEAAQGSPILLLDLDDLLQIKREGTFDKYIKL